MPDSIDIDDLVAQINKAAGDKTTPPWVAVLLQTVLLLVTTMKSHLSSLETENAKLRKQVYGKKTERRPRQKKAPAKAKRVVGKGPSALDGADLPERVEEHKLPEESKSCELCGGSEFAAMPTGERSTVYTYEPARLVRVTHVREKCASRNGCGIVTAPGPPKVVEGGRFSASLYADIVTKRSFDAIPFHRQADAFSRTGIPLSATTVCDLFHSTADVLAPLYDALIEEVRSSDLVHADETP